MERSRFYWVLFIGLRSRRDKSFIYLFIFFFCHGMVVYFKIQSLPEKSSKKKKKKKKNSLFSFLARKSAVRLLVYLVNSGSNYYAHRILWNLRFIETFYCKTKLFSSSVCISNAMSKRRHLTSHNVTFIDVIGALYHVAFNQIEMRSLFGQLTYCLCASIAVDLPYPTPLHPTTPYPALTYPTAP